MREFRRFLNPSLRRLVRREVCVGGVGITGSVVVISWDLRCAAIVHTGGCGMGKVAKVEHGARGWHGINKVPTHINRATLQIGVGKTAIALHAVVFVLGSRVPFLLRDAST